MFSGDFRLGHSKNRRNQPSYRINYEGSQILLIFVLSNDDLIPGKPKDPNHRRPKDPNLRKNRQYPKSHDSVTIYQNPEPPVKINPMKWEPNHQNLYLNENLILHLFPSDPKDFEAAPRSGFLFAEAGEPGKSLQKEFAREGLTNIKGIHLWNLNKKSSPIHYISTWRYF